jgi:hypothetical protein
VLPLPPRHRERRQLAQALKNSVVRAAIEKLYPELVLPGPKNPPDPAPLRTFTPLMLPTPRSPGLPPRTVHVTRTVDEVTTRQLASSQRASSALLDGALTQRIGSLLDGLQAQLLLCRRTTLGNYGLRFQEYDRTAAELGGGAYTGTGDRESLGTTATDPFGNYVFRFSRTLSEVVDEVLHDVAVSEDATVQVLPDLIAQVLGAGLIPAAETGCFFNVHNLQRIDICVPDTNVVLPSSCVDDRILTFIGKISMTSALNSLDATGRITAHSTAGNAPRIDCGVWWGDPDLWGCLGTDVSRYTLRTRPLGSGPRRLAVPREPGAARYRRRPVEEVQHLAGGRSGRDRRHRLHAADARSGRAERRPRSPLKGRPHAGRNPRLRARHPALQREPCLPDDPCGAAASRRSPGCTTLR